MRTLTLWVSLLLLSGCATQRGMDQMMATWRNGNINDFIARAGPPQQVYDMPNGDKIFVFSRSSTTTTPVYQSPTYTTSDTTIQMYGNTGQATTTGTTYGGQVYGGQTFTQSCTIRMQVDSSQTIIGYSYEGNACRVRER